MLDAAQCGGGRDPAHASIPARPAATSRKNPTAIVIGIGARARRHRRRDLRRHAAAVTRSSTTTTRSPRPCNDGWRTFTPPDGTFTISFPGMPERGQNAIDSLNQVAQGYSMKQGDFEFGVVVSPAPAYTAPHEAGKRLAEWMRPIYEGQGGVIEGAAQLITPRGDQAFDLVVVNGGVRNWLRFTTWNGSIIRVYATLPADQAADHRTVTDLQPPTRLGAPVDSLGVRSSRVASTREGTTARRPSESAHVLRPCRPAR